MHLQAGNFDNFPGTTLRRSAHRGGSMLTMVILGGRGDVDQQATYRLL